MDPLILLFGLVVGVLIGLTGVGGGSLVRNVHPVPPGAAIDAVELHRPVLELARRWFGLPAGPWVDYPVDDGRRFLGRTRARYDLNVVEVHMSSLRRKLEERGPRLIRTVRSVGYVLRPALAA